MAKAAVKYACAECGYTAGRWFGKCPGCNAFGTLVEESLDDTLGTAAPKPLLRLVDVDAAEAERIATGVPELDRVLGGGLVPASLVLVGGEPGVGKSTLLLTALRAMSHTRRVVLVTGAVVILGGVLWAASARRPRPVPTEPAASARIGA